MSLLCVGSIALDNVTTPHGEVKDSLGGSAVYFSLAARHFGTVSVVGVVGDDFPAHHLSFLADRGVDTEGVERMAGKTFRWTGSYEGDMGSAETRAVELGVFGTFQPTLPDSYRDIPFVFLANGSPHTQMAVVEQMRNPRFIAADTMNLWIEDERDALLALLKRIHCLFINDGEARMLAGETNLVTCGRTLRSLGPASVIIKKGEHGAILFDGERILPLPAFPAETVVDPTGAGDSFAGGFMGYTAARGDGDPGMERGLAYGTVVASFTISRFGPRALVEADRDALDERLAAYRSLMQAI